MNFETFIIFVWLMGLTVSQVLTASAIVELRRLKSMVDARAAQLDQAERMQRIIDLFSGDRAASNNEIRRQVELLLDTLEADPLAKEKHWVAIQVLRSKLTQ